MNLREPKKKGRRPYATRSNCYGARYWAGDDSPCAKCALKAKCEILTAEFRGAKRRLKGGVDTETGGVGPTARGEKGGG